MPDKVANHGLDRRIQCQLTQLMKREEYIICLNIAKAGFCLGFELMAPSAIRTLDQDTSRYSIATRYLRYGWIASYVSHSSWRVVLQGNRSVHRGMWLSGLGGSGEA